MNNNILIAEFMGYEYLNKEFGFDTHANDLKFNKSWDWLMPVVEKIINNRSSCCLFTGRDYLPVLTFSMLDDEEHPFQGSSESNLLEACYSAVIEFIKWYNKNNLK